MSGGRGFFLNPAATGPVALAQSGTRDERACKMFRSPCSGCIWRLVTAETYHETGSEEKGLEPEPVYGKKGQDTQRERRSLNWCKLHTEQEAKKREGGDQSNDAVPDMQEKERDRERHARRVFTL